MEKYTKAIPFAAIQLCEDCGKGEFLPNGDNSYVPDIKIGHSCLQTFFGIHTKTDARFGRCLHNQIGMRSCRRILQRSARTIQIIHSKKGVLVWHY